MSEKEETKTFAHFGFKESLMKGVNEAGFRIPSPIQAEAIPFVLKGSDIIAQAHTGTGKTAAFVLPAIQKMEDLDSIQLMVITPTRELAMQVSDEVYRLGHHAGVSSITVCGGQSYTRQIKRVERGCPVLVATPGRLLDLMKSKKLKNCKPSMIVIDEADEMLDMGFLDDINEIFTYLPEERQTMLFSATMPDPIRRLANKILRDPIHIKTILPEENEKDIRQLYYVIDERERREAVVRLIEDQVPSKAIIFCRMRNEVDELCTFLSMRGYSTKALHGDMEQPRRQEVMGGFRKGHFDMLVATDVAARGLDVADVSHVFNFHIPFDTRSYIHRIGRTGRAGKTGTAVTLVTPSEYRKLERIQHATGSKMEHGMIPCLKTLRLSRINRLREKLDETTILPEAHELVNTLEEETTLHDLATRLISHILGEQDEGGPDQIGLNAERLKQVMKPGRKGGGGGGARRFGGNNRRGKPFRGRGGKSGGEGGRGQGGSSRKGKRSADRGKRGGGTGKPSRSK